MSPFERLRRLHGAVFEGVERAAGGWLPGLAARLVFAAVLFGYFWSAALTKIEIGPHGLPALTAGAYVQVLPGMMEAVSYDESRIPFLPWGFVVAMGTWAELLLPAMIVLGLLTQIAAAGMIVFILVQSWVDVAFHGADERTVGALFDRDPNSLILDQRVLWVFLLLVLVLKGAGAVSLDGVWGRLRR